ncbi:membrane-associated tyrosine- and threonine-specific cdc2-inhibitory kinase [Trichonephila clavipes]|nr:membrane-associated tyrosine- and threonine-specific cdc2-inhibitory kinase [Trichonephila clavipes]
MLNSCVMHRHTGPALGIMVLATVIFQQDNVRPHVACIVQRFFINHQIELLPWPARSLDLLPIENMWSMVAERLTQITPPAATPDQLWQHVEAAWSASLSSKYDSTGDLLYFHQCFEIISKIGSGSFGDVFKVKCIEDGNFYAVKRAKQKFAGKADRERKLQEVQKHEQLPYHPNCVRFYAAWEEQQILYIQIELCKYSLSQYADENHNITETTVWNFLIDLLLAVKHLHDHNLVHLDIKPDNIFISKYNICKLGDFGLVLDLSKLLKHNSLQQSDQSSFVDLFQREIHNIEISKLFKQPKTSLEKHNGVKWWMEG